MDIKKLKNNREFYDSLKFMDDKKVELSIKEDPEFNIHIWEGYFDDIFEEPIFNGKDWVGFTRDYQELKGGWEKKSEIENIDEYIWDMLRYKGGEYDVPWEGTPEVFNLIIDFLTYAKQTGQTVVVEVD